MSPPETGYDACVLLVLVEISTSLWNVEGDNAPSDTDLTLSAFIDQLGAFLNAFGLLHHVWPLSLACLCPFYGRREASPPEIPVWQLADTPDALSHGVLGGLHCIAQENHLAVMSVGDGRTNFLYESCEISATSTAAAVTTDPDAVPVRPAPAASVAGGAGGAVVRALQATIAATDGDDTDDEGASPPLALSAALSRALCYLQRVSLADQVTRGRPRPARVLCLTGSPDHAPQYIAVMNAIFAAQKVGVVIDSCRWGVVPSPFLQQAAHLTGGIYFAAPPPAKSLLQHLLTLFLPDVGSRKWLRQPPSGGTDFKASCFCHQRAIDQGHVCSVCLSLFCEPARECSTCGTEFAMTTGRDKGGGGSGEAGTPQPSGKSS